MSPGLTLELDRPFTRVGDTTRSSASAAVGIAPNRCCRALTTRQHGWFDRLLSRLGLLQVTVNLPEAVVWPGSGDHGMDGAGRPCDNECQVNRASFVRRFVRIEIDSRDPGAVGADLVRPALIPVEPVRGRVHTVDYDEVLLDQAAEAIEGNDADAIDPRDAGGAV